MVIQEIGNEYIVEKMKKLVMIKTDMQNTEDPHDGRDYKFAK